MHIDKQKGVLHKIPFCIFYLCSIIHAKPVYTNPLLQYNCGNIMCLALHNIPFLRTDLCYGYAKKYKK